MVENKLIYFINCLLELLKYLEVMYLINKQPELTQYIFEFHYLTKSYHEIEILVLDLQYKLLKLGYDVSLFFILPKENDLYTLNTNKLYKYINILTNFIKFNSDIKNVNSIWLESIKNFRED